MLFAMSCVPDSLLCVPGARGPVRQDGCRVVLGKRDRSSHRAPLVSLWRVWLLQWPVLEWRYALFVALLDCLARRDQEPTRRSHLVHTGHPQNPNNNPNNTLTAPSSSLTPLLLPPTHTGCTAQHVPC